MSRIIAGLFVFWGAAAALSPSAAFGSGDAGTQLDSPSETGAMKRAQDKQSADSQKSQRQQACQRDVAAAKQQCKGRNERFLQGQFEGELENKCVPSKLDDELCKVSEGQIKQGGGTSIVSALNSEISESSGRLGKIEAYNSQCEEAKGKCPAVCKDVLEAVKRKYTTQDCEEVGKIADFQKSQEHKCVAGLIGHKRQGDEAGQAEQEKQKNAEEQKARVAANGSDDEEDGGGSRTYASTRLVSAEAGLDSQTAAMMFQSSNEEGVLIASPSPSMGGGFGGAPAAHDDWQASDSNGASAPTGAIERSDVAAPSPSYNTAAPRFSPSAAPSAPSSGPVAGSAAPSSTPTSSNPTPVSSAGAGVPQAALAQPASASASQAGASANQGAESAAVAPKGAAVAQTATGGVGSNGGLMGIPTEGAAAAPGAGGAPMEGAKKSTEERKGVASAEPQMELRPLSKDSPEGVGPVAGGGGSGGFGMGGKGNALPSLPPSSASAPRRVASSAGGGGSFVGGGGGGGGGSSRPWWKPSFLTSFFGGRSPHEGLDAPRGANVAGQVDLRKFLPGQANDPAGTSATARAAQGIHGPDTFIWSAVKSRYKSLDATLLTGTSGL